MYLRLLLPHRSTVQPLAEKRVEGRQDVIWAPSGVRMHAVYILALLSFPAFPTKKQPN